MPKTSVPILNYSVYLESQYCKKQLYFSQRKEHWDNRFFFTLNLTSESVYRDRLSKCRCLSCRKQYIDFMLFCSYTILLLSTYLAENVDSDCRGNKVVSFGIMTVSPLLNFIHPLPLVVLYKLQVQKRAYSRYQFNSVFVMSLSYLPCLSSLLQ